MNNYDFISKDFALSAEGVHLLRNGFNHKTINFYDVEKATFKRAADTNNVWLTLIAGGLLILFALLQSLGVVMSFYGADFHIIHTSSIAVVALPFAAGIYCIYMVVKKVPLLLVEAGNKKYKLSLEDIIKKQQKENLKVYLTGKLNVRFYDEL